MKTNTKSDDVDDEDDDDAVEDFTPNMQLTKSRKLAQRACKDLCCFLSFLTTFTIVQVVGQTADTSLFAQHIRVSFSPGLEDVVDTDSWFTYIQTTFLPKAFFFQHVEPEFEPDTSMFSDAVDLDHWFLSTPSKTAFSYPDPDSLIAIDQSNYMLGAVRLRQYRVLPVENCITGSLFAHFNADCFKGFSRRKADLRVDADKPGTFGTLASSPPFSGTVATYSGDAFYIDFTSLDSAKQHVDLLQSQKYIDSGTRGIFLDFTVYNSNLDQFALTRISFEYGPSGVVDSNIRLSVMRRNYLGPFLFRSTEDSIASIGDIIIIIFLIYYIAEEVSELTVSRWDYLREGWNYMDWANMILLTLAFAYRIKVYLRFANVEVGAEQLEDRTKFTDFHSEADDVSTVRMLNSFNSVLLWIKCIKYIEFAPYIQFLYVTINTAADKYCSFLVVFFLLIVGFIHAFTIGFGSLLPNMVSFEVTAVSLLRSFLGDVDFLPVYQESPAFGAFLILAFYVMVMLVAVNVFFAIMASTITESKNKPVEEDLRHLAVHDAVQQIRGFVSRTMERFISEIPALHRRVYKKVTPATTALPVGAADNKLEKRRDSPISSASGEQKAFRDRKITDFTTKEVCNAADQMAGKLLMRIETASVEVRVEILRMKDSVEEMVNVTHVLGDRLGGIIDEQDAFLSTET